MSEKATLEFNGQKYDFPIVHGTEKEIAINISSLRAVTGGVTTIDPGLNAVSAEVSEDNTPMGCADFGNASNIFLMSSSTIEFSLMSS